MGDGEGGREEGDGEAEEVGISVMVGQCGRGNCMRGAWFFYFIRSGEIGETELTGSRGHDVKLCDAVQKRWVRRAASRGADSPTRQMIVLALRLFCRFSGVMPNHIGTSGTGK